MSRQHPTLPKNRSPCDLLPAESTNSFWHSQPSPLLTAHRSTRELPSTADVVVIGSGMTGTSVAYHLLTQDGQQKGGENAQGNGGPSVVMLEAREACWGATGRNGGHCQPLLFEHPHNPEIGHFELANFHALQNLIHTKSIDCEFVAQPGVRAIYSQQHLTDVELALLTMNATAPELERMLRLTTSKAELERFRVPTAVGAVVTSVAARMWPYKFVAHILEELLTSTKLRGNFNLQTLTPVETLTPYDDNRWSIKTARGTIIASRVVLATNAYTSHLLPGFADLIVPCRGQMSALVPPPSLSGEQNRLHTSLGFLGEGIDDYLIQRPSDRGGHLMFGGGRQHGPSLGTVDDGFVDGDTAEYLRGRLVVALGLPEGKRKEENPDDEVRCDYCHARKLHCIRSSALKPCTSCARFRQPCTNRHAASTCVAPEKEEPVLKELTATHQWTGIMGFSRDDLPWVGPVPEKPGLYLAAGFTGHGMPNTWLCGKAAALMVAKTLAPASNSLSTAAAAAAGAPWQRRIMKRKSPIGPFMRKNPAQAFLASWNEGDASANALSGAAPDDVTPPTDVAGTMFAAADEVGLPKAYLLTKERVVRAMDLQDVEARDWAETERRRKRVEADRPHSGYA